MKKMVLGISMILAGLIVLVPPATAAGVSHGAPDLSAFLASLAGPAPVTAAKSPALREKAIEAANANCVVGGGSVGCTGFTARGVDGNCSINEPGHVTCDGVTTWCPPCLDCAAEEQNCAVNCDPCSYRFSCNATTGDWSCRCILQGCPQ